MKHELTSFEAIIDRWPSFAKFREDLGVPYPTAAAMKLRDSIGAKHWHRIIEAAPKRGIEGVTWELLSNLARSKTPRKRKRAS